MSFGTAQRGGLTSSANAISQPSSSSASVSSSIEDARTGGDGASSSSANESNSLSSSANRSSDPSRAEVLEMKVREWAPKSTHD